MQNLIKLAKALHINLVPEIDTPGHALSFVKVRPDLMYQGSLSDYAGKHNVERVAMLDLDNKYDETLALSNPFMTNSSMVQMHRFMACPLFISERMNTMAAEKVIVAMSMI